MSSKSTRKATPNRELAVSIMIKLTGKQAFPYCFLHFLSLQPLPVSPSVLVSISISISISIQSPISISLLRAKYNLIDEQIEEEEISPKRVIKSQDARRNISLKSHSDKIIIFQANKLSNCAPIWRRGKIISVTTS